MKKLFVKFSMLLILLGMSVNVAWATNMSGMTDEQAQTMGFWARMTAKPATTTLGSGLVFVSEDEHAVEGQPTDGDYQSVHSAEGWSDIYLASSLISATVDFKVYAKANAGSYFMGWSFTDGYTDLGVGSGTYAAIKVNPSPKKGKANILDYTVYAAFEQVKLKSYAVAGEKTMTPENPTCTQTVTFRAETPGFWALSSADDVKHFKLPVITPKAGTAGTWTTSITEWNTSNISFYGDYAEIRVPVTFTAPNGNAAEYGAELVLETYAGVKMKVYLSARTTGGEGQAVRYDKNGNEVGRGDLTTMIAAATATDVVKLNGDYASPVTINKNLTFNLNGYTLSNTLTVSGGNVTIGYSAFGGSADALSVTGGKAILNGGSFGSLSIADGATVEQNGATFTGAATNNGTLTTTDGVFQSGLTSTKTLIANGGTFSGATAIQVTGGTASIKRGTIAGTQYGVLTNGGSATIEKLAVISGGTKALNNVGGSLTVNNGKFPNPSKFANGEITFKSAYFKTDAANIATTYTKQQWRNTAGPEFRDGYLYFVGDQKAAQASGVSVCRIGKVSYSSLADALAYANNHLDEEVIIIMENDYTLAAGYYTIPANATLIVPMSDDQETANPIVPRETNLGSTPTSFRRLTLESGVNMTVQGTIELTCTQHGAGEQMGVPGGNYGHLILKPGSHVTLSNGSVLRAWGFVTGDGTKDAEGNYLSGEIDARRGSTVREMFQMGDWKGGDISFTMAMEIPGMNPTWRDLTHLFPVYTYFIQNIESPVKYHPGSALICATSVNVSGSINAYANDIKVVGKDGEAAMFLMDEMADAENTWVRKYYDAKKDQQVYEVNSGAKLGSVVIDLGEVPGAMFHGTGTLKLMLDSRSFVLPLTSNFKIHLLTGYMEFTQSTSCLPGMEVEVDKEAEVALVNDHTPGVAQGALYLYDADQWSMDGSRGYVGNSGRFGAIVRYSATLDRQPEVRDITSPAAIGDAKLIVHGTFRSGEDCSVYTSWSKDLATMGLKEDGTGGASIISTNEDAGTFIFDADAPAFDGVKMDGSGNLTGIGTSVLVNYDHNDYGMGTQYPIQINTVLGSTQRVYGFELCTPAKLKNADGTFVETEGTLANTSYCYIDDKWTTMQVAEDPCFMKEIVGGQTTYYAKPAEYVAVNATWDGTNNIMVGNDDHTYSDKDGTGRLFILIKEDCQWWEVEKKDNLYHCIHPNNDTYYYWDDSNTNPKKHHWAEQRFTITWKNWDGVEIKSYTYDPNTGEPEEVEYSVTYGTQAEYLGENPTREPNIDYTYDFTGWSPALGPVTSNVTYTAIYREQPRKYAIIFTNEGGDEIERHLLTHNEIPVCENVPTKVGHTLVWEPAIAAVIGDVTYRATWEENPPTEYEVTFFDYDGKSILKQDNVAVGEMPESPVIMDGKPSGSEGKPGTNEFTYVFDHWSPTMEEVSATSIKSYTAVYREVAKKYTVIFQNEDGSEIERHDYSYGETPVCSATPTKENTPEWTYQLIWDPQIQTVMGDATYKADFETLKQKNKYTVTLRSNIPAACTFTSGAGTYDYGTVIAISKSDNPGYTFVNWTDGKTGEEVTELPVTVTGNISLVANFTINDPDYTISWMSEDGTETLKEVGQKAGTTTTYTGAVPNKPDGGGYTYTFDGWTTEANGAGTFYQNGKTPKATGNTSYFAHFIATPKKDPDPEQEPENLELDENDEVSIDTPTEYTNLTITSDGIDFSSQIINAENLTINGNADFVLTKSMERLHWYDVAVPWSVNATSGIFINGSATPAVLGSDIALYYYDGSVRATQGKVDACWKPATVLEPGRAYLFILYKTDATQVTFRKQDGAQLLTTETSVQENAQSTGNDQDAGWNGIANPSLFKAYLNAGTTVAQTINAAGDAYEAINADSYLVVGQPIYVQVTSSDPSVVANHISYAAPVRRTNASADPARYQLTITAEGANRHSDRLFVQLDEEKEENTYVIGKDLSKFGTSTKSAQMWVDRYDAKLCLNTVAPQGDATSFPMTLSAPKAGEYTIAIEREVSTEAYELYLTYGGTAIWNLSESAYTANLNQGTDARYGLRIVARTPQICTGVDEAVVNAQGSIRKVLVNEKVFIIRGNEVYTIDGQMVK